MVCLEFRTRRVSSDACHLVIPGGRKSAVMRLARTRLARENIQAARFFFFFDNFFTSDADREWESGAAVLNFVRKWVFEGWVLNWPIFSHYYSNEFWSRKYMRSVNLDIIDHLRLVKEFARFVENSSFTFLIRAYDAKFSVSGNYWVNKTLLT